MRRLDIGIAFETKPDIQLAPGAPTDILEEYDGRETIDALAGTLRSLGHDVRMLGGGRAFVEAVFANPPGLVFNNAEGCGSRSREAHVPAVCEMLGIPFTHSDPLTMALTLDKALAKRVVASAGIRTASFRRVDAPADLEEIDLPFPLFVKPAAEGSSMGVRNTSRVADRAGLEREVLRCLRDYRQPALIEAYLPGSEVTVGIVGSGARTRAIGSMEIAPAKLGVADFIYGLESKREYQEHVRYYAPPRHLSPAEQADATATALAAYRALGCRDIARVDLRFDAEGRANFLEVNALPGLNPVTGDIIVMTGLLGIDYAALIATIVEEAAWRYPGMNDCP